ncbi:hypothetical protein [Mesorhizobium sp. M1405]|uniref:hypothetical protein n=1 Tax=Mesorhizobium sp. M1405 TaxID=2957098 RepID=UPI0033363C76
MLHDRSAAEMPLLIDFATDLIRAGAGGLYQATESRRRPTRDVPMLEIDFYEQRCNLNRAMNANVEKTKWRPTPFQIMSRPKW